MNSAVLVTGANGHLGRRLLQQPGQWVAVVRSQRALAALPVGPNIRQCVLDYADSRALGEAMQGCAAAINLVGIIKESRANGFEQAHEHTAQALVAAAAHAGLARILQLSIVGATPRSSNACLASKGRADALLMRGATPALVLRLPMVLGEGDYASFALAKRARANYALTFRAQSLEQPIYAGDVVQALLNALALPLPASEALDLGGPTSLSRRALTERAASSMGRKAPVIISLPMRVGMGMAAIMELIAGVSGGAAPVTRAMLGVLDHDDAIDPLPACARLGLQLTSLQQTLLHCLPPTSASGHADIRGQ